MSHEHYRCGELTLVRTRQVTIAELLETTDDPEGFRKFSANAALPLSQLLALKVDVYEEPGSGASVPVPVNSQFLSVSGMCRIALPSGNVSLLVTSAHATQDEVQRVTIGWEETWTQSLPGLRWLANTETTYPKFMKRESDGLTTRRKDIVEYEANRPVVKVFETLIGRGATEIGIVVTRNSESDFEPTLVRQCFLNHARAACSTACDGKLYLQLVIKT